MADQKEKPERFLERDEEVDFWRTWGPADILSDPIGKLCKAQIDLVIWDIQSFYEGKKTAKKRFMVDAVDFINGRDNGLLSWQLVCETLSLSPSAVRGALYKKFEIDKLMQNSGMLF